jgi:pimeloyl-ACP methyl ester carboxylesterase
MLRPVDRNPRQDESVPTTIPATKYAKSGDVHIAYQVVGDGVADLILIPGWVSNIEYAWEEPTMAPFLRRLAGFSRLILLDRRGTGLSDRVSELPTLEQRMDDVRAVMDAAGVERATLFGLSEGGPMSMLFAATYPERTAGLVLYGTFARLLRASDYPAGIRPEVFEVLLQMVEASWGTGLISANHFAPSHAGDEAFRHSWGRFERLGVSPAGMQTLLRMLPETDARSVLPIIRVPTLVLHRSGDQIIRVEAGRYVADHIDGAKFVELPGVDHFAWAGDRDALLAEVEEFVTGTRRPAEADRVLATVLFTDIVGATERAVALGDRRWRELLDRHHATVREQLERFQGREIDTAGDGFLASFDGPARAVRCATAIVAAVGRLGIDVRAGLHSGECEIFGGKLSGVAVHTGARVASLAQAGEVLVSRTVKDLVAGSGIAFEARGTQVLKGLPGEWELFAVATA